MPWAMRELRDLRKTRTFDGLDDAAFEQFERICGEFQDRCSTVVKLLEQWPGMQVKQYVQWPNSKGKMCERAASELERKWRAGKRSIMCSAAVGSGSYVSHSTSRHICTDVLNVVNKHSA